MQQGRDVSLSCIRNIVGPNDRSAADIGLMGTTSIADKMRSDKARAFKHKKNDH